MERITYHDLVARFGSSVALNLLLSVEMVAGTSGTLIGANENDRFQKALEAINTINFATGI